MATIAYEDISNNESVFRRLWVTISSSRRVDRGAIIVAPYTPTPGFDRIPELLMIVYSRSIAQTASSVVPYFTTALRRPLRT